MLAFKNMMPECYSRTTFGGFRFRLIEQPLTTAQACNKWGGRGGRGPPPPQILADQVTLFKPGVRLCPPHYYLPPLEFQTFLHDPEMHKVIHTSHPLAVHSVTYFSKRYRKWIIYLSSTRSISVVHALTTYFDI